jgi:hypothetical protein
VVCSSLEDLVTSLVYMLLFYLISLGLKLDNESPFVAVNYLFIVGVVCMDRKSSAKSRLKRSRLAFVWSYYFWP